MDLRLNPEIERLISEQIKSGRFATAEEVVAAALLMLDQREWLDEIAGHELDELLSEGERSIVEEGTLDGDEAFRLRRDRRHRTS